MAHFRKLDSGKWQALVRRNGFPVQTKTFLVRVDAERWARHVETDMDTGGFIIPVKDTSVGSLIERYIAEVCVLKRGCKQEVLKLQLLKGVFGSYSVSALRSKDVAAWRDKRLAAGKAGATVVRDLACLSHVLEVAMKDWNVGISSNPVRMVRKPSVARGRDRRVTHEELLALKTSAIGSLVTLAVETGMRLGELLALEWNLISIESRTAVLPITKNGEKRVVPLTTPKGRVLKSKRKPVVYD